MTTQNPQTNGQASKADTKIDVGSLRPKDLSFAPKINISASQQNLMPQINCNIPNGFALKKPTLQPPTSFSINIAPGSMKLPGKSVNEKKPLSPNSQVESGSPIVVFEKSPVHREEKRDRNQFEFAKSVENMGVIKSESFHPAESEKNSNQRLSQASALSTSTPTFQAQSSGMSKRATANTMIQVPSTLIDINSKSEHRASIQSEKPMIKPLIAVPPKMKLEFPIAQNSSKPQLNIGSGLNQPIVVNTNDSSNGSNSSLLHRGLGNSMKSYQTAELNLQGLSDDEEESKTAKKPKTSTQPFNMNQHNEKRLLDANAQLIKQESKQSQSSHVSEELDMVQPLQPMYQRTQSMAPMMFSDMTLDTDVDDRIPKQFAFNSFSQAKKNMERLYADYEQVRSLARGYREDYLTLQNFVRNYFKNMEMVLKHKDLVEDERTAEVLKSCFQETPMVAMAFASPLVKKFIDSKTGEERVDMMDLLDFSKEFEGAKAGIKETGNAIKVEVVPATLEKFTNCLTEKPIGLHFTGHGIQNRTEEIGLNAMDLRREGNCLVFEKEDGSAHFISQKKLKDLFEMNVSSLKFVFIATCHSEFAGEIFHNAGVEHVICVRKDAEILDEAAISFAKSFYKLLFMQKYTICDAFDKAKKILQANPDAEVGAEANKLMLILDTDSVAQPDKTSFKSGFTLSTETLITERKCHKCSILGPFKRADEEILDQQTTYPFEVAKVTEFVGRQREMHEIISCVLLNRLTTIQGMPGMGKTTIAKTVGHHLNERRTFHDGVMFFSMRGVDQTSGLVQQMHLYFTRVTKEEDTQENESQNQSMAQKNKALKQYSVATTVESQISAQTEAKDGPKQVDYESMEIKIQTTLAQKQVLIIIDNVEDVLREDEDKFRELIHSLLSKLPGLSILMTSRDKISNIGEITEKLYEMQALSNQFSIELLEKKALRLITSEEIKELFEQKNVQNDRGGTPFQSQVEAKGGSFNLADHHLCTLLGGHPFSITLVAPFLQGNRSLTDLYKMLLSMIDSGDFMRDVQGLDPTQKLKVSLDASTLTMRHEQPEALNLFCLIGMLPGGVSEDDLSILWKAGHWMPLIEHLRRASLIVEKTEQDRLNNKSVRKFRLLPFMNKYAESLLNSYDHKTFRDKCCRFLLDKCAFLFTVFHTEAHRLFNNEYRLAILEYEVNIWSVIYRIRDLNKKKDEARQAEQSVSNHQHSVMDYTTADEYETVLLKNSVSVYNESSDNERDQVRQKSDINEDDPASPDNWDKKLVTGNYKPSQLKRFRELAVTSAEQSSEDQLQQSDRKPRKQASLVHKQNSAQASPQILNPISDQSGETSNDQQQLTFGQIDSRLDESIQNISESQDLINSKSQTNRSDGEEKAILDELDKRNKRVKFNLDKSGQQTTSDISFIQQNRSQTNNNSNNLSPGFRAKNNVSPFTTNLSGILYEGRERSDSDPDQMVSRSFAHSMPKVSPYTSIISQDDDVLGSINQSNMSASVAEVSPQILSEKIGQSGIMVKSKTEKNLRYNELLTDMQSDTMNDQIETNLNLSRHGQSQEPQESGEIITKQESALTEKALKLHDENMKRLDNEEIHNDGNESQPTHYDVSFSKHQSHKITGSSEPQDNSQSYIREKENTTSDNVTIGKTLHSETQGDISSMSESQQFGAVTRPQNASDPQFGAATKNWPKEVSFQNQKLINNPIPGRRFGTNKSFGGMISTTLKAPLDIIQEDNKMSVETRLIITYISLLVIDEKISEAERAIDIVHATHIRERLLRANIKKLHAMCLMKQKNPKINEAYKQLREASKLFENESTRLQQNSDGNLGMALCNFGMGWLMFTKLEYFVQASRDYQEEKLLRNASSHFEIALQIYQNRDHYSGQAYCLKALSQLRRKQRMNFQKLTQEYRRLQKIVANRAKDPSSEPIKGLNPWIERYNGNDVSLMIEIVDSDQIKWTNVSQRDTRQSLHPKSILNSGSKSPRDGKKGQQAIKIESLDGIDSRRKHQPKRQKNKVYESQERNQSHLVTMNNIKGQPILSKNDSNSSGGQPQIKTVSFANQKIKTSQLMSEDSTTEDHSKIINRQPQDLEQIEEITQEQKAKAKKQKKLKDQEQKGLENARKKNMDRERRKQEEEKQKNKNLYEYRKKSNQVNNLGKVNQNQIDGEEEKFNQTTPKKQTTKIGMGVSKLVGKDLESNNQVDSNNRDGFVDFTRDYQSNLSSARNSIHSIRTVTTNADFADTESVARFDPEAYKKNAQKKIPQLKNLGANQKQKSGSAKHLQEEDVEEGSILQLDEQNPFGISHDAKPSMIGAGSARTSKQDKVKQHNANVQKIAKEQQESAYQTQEERKRQIADKQLRAEQNRQQNLAPKQKRVHIDKDTKYAMKLEEQKRKTEEKQQKAEAFRKKQEEKIKEKAAKTSAAITGEKKKPDIVYHITLTYGEPHDFQNTAKSPSKNSRPNSAQKSENKLKEKDEK